MLIDSMPNSIVWSIYITYFGLLLSFIFGFYRLLLGPTFADRVVALDLIGSLTIGFIVVHALDKQEDAFLDIAITLALVVFLGTVVFVQFIIQYQDIHGDK